MQQPGWVNNPSRLVRFRPGCVVSIISDSIGAPQSNGGWQQEVQNRCAMLYGDSQPTWNNHGIGGATIQSATSVQVPLVQADNPPPDIILIELGVNNVGGQPSRASIASAAGLLLSPLRSSFPNAMIGWSTMWTGNSEQWNPDPNEPWVSNINNGIADACATYNAQVIDGHTWYQVDAQINNPSNLSSGINTVDGTHPNWRGRPMLGRAWSAQVYFDDPLYIDVDATPTWTPSSDVTPTFFIEADALTPGPVNSWGPFSKFATGTAPTCISGGWTSPLPTGTGQANMPCVRFNGTSDVMTAALSVAAGAKTLVAVYRLRQDASSFGTFFSLLTLTNGTVTSEIMPSFALSPNQTYVNCDMKFSGADGFFFIGTQGMHDSSGDLYPIRLISTFAGGSSTDTAQYAYYWGGASVGLSKNSGFYAQNNATALCALGARIENGTTPTSYCPVDIVALGAYPVVLTTVQRARLGAYLRRKWGP
jgi:lysophospholipase L1-like esterase